MTGFMLSVSCRVILKNNGYKVSFRIREIQGIFTTGVIILPSSAE
jgi:hypothetical protein